ncbi:hypothetical protein [Haloarchaeobius sp. HRN-SO-5]|uniref:hypothetical protein n=1 Tax=Haloarchaeobius sp. HRN-SO-5 TaxID=3446118 RepID=UPI003EC130BB
MTGSRPSQTGAAVLVLLLVASSLLGASVAATDAGATTPRQDAASPGQQRPGFVGTAFADGMHVRYVLSPADPDEGRVRVRAEFRLSAAVSRVAIRVPESATVVDVDGFVPDEDGEYDYEWDGSVRTSVTYETSATRFANGGVESIATDEWSFLYEPAVGLASVDWWYYPPRPPSSRTLALGDGVEGYAGDEVAVFGDVDVTESTHDGHTYRVVRSAAAGDGRSAETVMALLTAADESFPVGDRGASTTVVVPPDEVRTGGLATVRRGSDREFWAHGSTAVFAHEVVHVRQSFRLATDDEGRSMRWLLEGMAEYHAAVVEVRAGRITRDEFRDHVTTDRHADAVLTDRSTWQSPGAQYEKGRRVVAALDAEIRAATDGERSFVDVWRRLNEHEGPVDYDDFAHIVGTVAERDMTDWLDRYVDGDEAPAVGERPAGLFSAPDAAALAVDAAGPTVEGETSPAPAASPSRLDAGGAWQARPYAPHAVVVVLSVAGLGVLLVVD